MEAPRQQGSSYGVGSPDPVTLPLQEGGGDVVGREGGSTPLGPAQQTYGRITSVECKAWKKKEFVSLHNQFF